MATPRPAKQGYRRRLAAGSAALFAALLCVLGWLAGSESGLRLIAAGLATMTGDRLQIEAPGGRLFGDWHAQSLRWRDAAQDVEIRRLTVSWSPGALLHGELLFERVAADSLRIFLAPSAEPAVLPTRLELPLALQIAQLALGRVSVGTADDAATTVAANIEATFSSDGRRHRLERTRAQLGKLALAADATLVGEQPFALAAQATLTGAVLDRPFVFTLQADGSLDQLDVDGTAATAAEAPTAATSTGVTTLSGTLHAQLTPFASRPLKSLRLQASSIDPSALLAGAPAALLDIEARLDSEAAMVTARAPQPAEAATIGGSLLIINRRDGTLDRQRLPIRSLAARLLWGEQRLAIDALNATLGGDGRLVGRGGLKDGELELELTGQRINARALHGQLMPTRLSGPLQARVGAARQQLEIDLRDEQYAVSAQASLSPDLLELANLHLTAGDARLSGQGQLALGGDGRFAAEGELANFDPSRFWRPRHATVRAVINAGVALQGALRPTRELALRFDLRDSRLGKQTLSGQGVLDLLGSHLRKIDLDVRAAGNRLVAQGSFGAVGDKLRLRLQAPRLAEIGLTNLTGDASATIDIAGTVASPEFSGEIRADRLRLADWLDVRDLSFNGQLGADASGPLAGSLRCGACASPAYGLAPLSIDATLDGLRNRHHLAARIVLPEQRDVRLALDGGWQTDDAGKAGNGNIAMSWHGTLTALRVGKVAATATLPWLELLAPTPLRVDATALSFGPADFAGLLGKLRIERLGHDQGRWRSAGRWQQLRPQVVLNEFPTLQTRLEASGQADVHSLVLAGDWDIALDNRGAARPAGRTSLWREAGDLSLGGVPLGLGDVRFQAKLNQGQLVVDGQLHGQRLGDISVELAAASALGQDDASGSPTSLFEAHAPWQGRLQARVADLTWLGPLLGENWQVAGQLSGEMRLTGSAAQPRVNGEWHGESLALRALDQGLRLERGQARIEITPETLRLHRLHFESDLQPLPRILTLDERIDRSTLTGTPGRFEASGELSLTGAGDHPARVSVLLDRVGVMQHADQWVAVSGTGEVKLGKRRLDIDGKLRVDAGYWSLGPAGKPTLSSDVVIQPPPAARGTGQAAPPSAATPSVRLDLEANFGRSFHFQGAGVESRLAGQIRVRSDNAELPRATGSIRTVDGRFDAYGQKLAIERGIVNFQGAIDNPGLNLLAVRKNLPVEAGVEVTGTMQRPVIRLVSTPVVPDAEKLSWLVLGQAPDQQSGADSSLLFAAAQTILGGQDGGVLSKLQRGLGIDEFGVSSGQVGGGASLPTSRVASSNGFSGSETMNGQIVSVGKRLSSRAVLTYEKSLNSAENIVKLTVNLNRQFSLVGRAGSESALDLFWNSSFGR